MKKIPTLFKRIYENHKVVGITDEVTEGCEFVLEGKGTPTVKYDGSCCAIIGGELYKRYDAKKGKKAPEGAIPCQDAPDEITGHFPHWVKCDRNNPADKWFFKAYEITKAVSYILTDGTYEAIGEHFQGNPYHLEGDVLVKHGEEVINAKLDNFETIKEFLKNNDIEGIVFWLDGEPRCKIKRSDFGFEWGVQVMQAIIEGNLYEVEPAVKVIIDKLMIENAELKKENARLEEGYQKSLGVIAATDCTECKKDAEPIKHGELWVSCNERMPETLTETLDGRYSECCLVFAEETEWIGMAYYRTNNNKSWWEFADAQNKPKIDWAEITHWMPLPNCPNCGAKMYGGTDRQWTDKITTGEYQPIKHGRWKEKLTVIYCSCCHLSWSKCFSESLRRTYKYCPNCGAKMDGGAENESV